MRNQESDERHPSLSSKAPSLQSKWCFIYLDSKEVAPRKNEICYIKLRGQTAVLTKPHEVPVDPAVKCAIYAVKLKKRPGGEGTEGGSHVMDLQGVG